MEEIQKIKEVWTEIFEKGTPQSIVSELWRQLSEEYAPDILPGNFELLNEQEQLGFLHWVLKNHREKDLSARGFVPIFLGLTWKDQ